MHGVGSTESSPVTGAQRAFILVSLTLQILIYFSILVFIIFNFWRIMIRLNKIKLIPLTIFYVSATVIVTSRICDCSGFSSFYLQHAD